MQSMLRQPQRTKEERAEEIAGWLDHSRPESVRGQELWDSIGEELARDPELTKLVNAELERLKRQKGGCS